MSMEKPLHFVFWRFRQNWAENLGAKFEAKALDKLCKESVCIPGRNIHGGVYFSGSLDRTIPYYIEKNDLWGRRSFHVKEHVNCSWKTSQKVKDAKRNEKSEKRGCQTCRDVVLYLSAKGRRKEWLLKAAEAKRKNQYGYVEKRATCSVKSKSFWKKCLTKNHFCGKIIKSSAARLRRTGPWKLNNIEKLVTEPIFVLEKHVKQFQTK